MSLDMSMIIDRLRMDKKNPLKAALVRYFKGILFRNFRSFYHFNHTLDGKITILWRNEEKDQHWHCLDAQPKIASFG